MSIQINGWGEPDQSWIGIRNTEEIYAKNFVERGQIKFNTPQSWVNYAEKNIGRGDPFDGMVCCCYESDKERINHFRKKYPELREDYYKGTIIFRREKDMNLPCFCYYSISNKLFTCPPTPGIHTLSYHISPDYFTAFDDLKPAIVTFRIYEVIEKLKQYLYMCGVGQDEILIQKVNYFKFVEGMWIDTNAVFPYELFCKTSFFSNQKEDRIVINSTKPEILKILEKPIEIGSLHEHNIAQVFLGAQMEKENGLNVSISAQIQARQKNDLPNNHNI